MCAEIITLLLRNLPDCVWWVDYTTTPVTMNFGARSSLPALAIAVVSGAPSSGFTAKRRDDLLVPAVILKYQETITVDGLSTSHLTVDNYPPTVMESTPGVLINTIDLTGGHATYQKEEVTTRARPVTGLEVGAMAWLLKHNSLLKSLDYSNMTMTGLVTTVNPDDPAAVDLDSNTLAEELLTGAVTPWMKTNDSILAIDASLLCQVSYSGDDDATLAYFTNQPQPGTAQVPVQCKITNAQTQTYQELTAFQQAEAPPIGLAEYLFGVLSALHFEGTLELTNLEATNPLPIGCVFNTTDGNAQWRSMNALVLKVDIDVDAGKTKITFGPTVSLDANDLVDLIRAQSAPLYSWQLNQRTTGTAGAENAVIGHAHSSAAASNSPLIPTPTPFMIFIRPAPVAEGEAPSGDFQAKVILNSNLLKTVTPGDNQVITGLDSWFTFYPGEDMIWLEVSCDETSTPTGATIKSVGMGDDWDPADPPQPSRRGSGAIEYHRDTDDDGNVFYTQTLSRVALFESTGGDIESQVNKQLVSTPLLWTPDTYTGPTADDDEVTFGYYKPVAHGAQTAS
jgi:hypothetical protein